MRVRSISILVLAVCVRYAVEEGGLHLQQNTSEHATTCVRKPSEQFKVGAACSYQTMIHHRLCRNNG